MESMLAKVTHLLVVLGVECLLAIALGDAGTVLVIIKLPFYDRTRIRPTPVLVSVLRLCLYPYVRVGVYAVYIYAGSHICIRT